MINKHNAIRLDGVLIMSNSKTSHDIWEEIFNDLILESEPPVRYIKDAVIITRSGASYRVSPDDYINIVARAKMIGPENSDIHSCSLSIDFPRIKRDVNRWANKFMTDLEGELAKEIEPISESIEQPTIIPVVKNKTTPKKKLTKP